MTKGKNRGKYPNILAGSAELAPSRVSRVWAYNPNMQTQVTLSRAAERSVGSALVAWRNASISLLSTYVQCPRGRAFLARTAAVRRRRGTHRTTRPDDPKKKSGSPHE